MIPMKRLDPEKLSEMPIHYLVGSAQILAAMPEQKALVPFADRILAFLDALSRALLQDPAIHGMPDAAAFAFWCRGGSLRHMKQEYGGQNRLGRGVTVHFAPSNIPVLFAFTMASGLLSGSCAIVRLSSRSSAQEIRICAHIRELAEGDFPDIAPRIVLCRYEHNREITDMLSSICDVRVLWGSDSSVSEIRRSPLPPRGIDMPFAARGSAAVIRAGEINRTDQLDIIARNFYNDTYLNDQNACSSPVMIGWLGEDAQVQSARKKFWDEMARLLDEKGYTVSADLAFRKLSSAYVLAALDDVRHIERPDNRLVCVEVSSFCENMWEYTVPGGFFIECSGTDLRFMQPILSEHCQTLCCIGIDPTEFSRMVIAEGLKGVDRIVGAGHTLDYTLSWDGFRVIDMMSRAIFTG